MDDILDTPKEVDERESGMRLTQVNKIILDRIRKELKLEKPKKEIFQDIIVRYGTKYEKITGLTVASSLFEHQKIKFRKWQITMIVLLVICVLSSAYHKYLTYTIVGSLSEQIIEQFFNIFFGVVLVNGIIKFKGFILNFIILIAAIKIVNVALRYYDNIDYWIVVLITLYVITASLAYVMRKKIFPNLGRLGPKKTAGGDYIF